jgi:hypothetical protein
MPVHDYWCPVCGQVLIDIMVPIAIGQKAGAPTHCGQSTHPIPGIGRMDIGAVKTAGFHGFETTDGRGHPVTIDSLHKLRQVERESEQMYRDGVGQPMVWRRWAQDGSNADQPTLSRSYYGGDAPEPAAKQRFGSTLQKSGSDAEGQLTNPDLDRAYGPGVDEHNASALEDK